jgi:SlyX protein
MANDALTDIETTLAFHDKTINDLSDVLNQQWAEIEKLKRQLKMANNKIEELESSAGQSDESNVKPPHW